MTTLKRRIGTKLATSETLVAKLRKELRPGLDDLRVRLQTYEARVRELQRAMADVKASRDDAIAILQATMQLIAEINKTARKTLQAPIEDSWMAKPPIRNVRDRAISLGDDFYEFDIDIAEMTNAILERTEASWGSCGCSFVEIGDL